MVFEDIDGNTYSRFFEVVEVIPSQVKPEGSIITLKMLGTEYHTQMVPYSGQSFFTNPFRVGRLIGEQYEEFLNRIFTNNSKGTSPLMALSSRPRLRIWVTSSLYS